MDHFRDISMVSENCQNYRCFCARFARIHRAGRKRDTLQADYTKQLIHLEKAVRELLACLMPSGDNRVLRYLQKNANHIETVEYREIDFVVAGNKGPAAFIEMKFRERVTCRNKLGQLGKSLGIARVRWPQLKGLWLNIHTAPLFGLHSEPKEQMQFLELGELAGHLGRIEPHEEITPLWLSGNEVVGEAIRRDLLPAGFVEQLKVTRETALNPLSLLGRSTTKSRCLGDLFPSSICGFDNLATAA